MSSVIIKSDERRQREDKILGDFGYDKRASAEIREHAEHVAEKSHEALKEMRRN